MSNKGTGAKSNKGDKKVEEAKAQEVKATENKNTANDEVVQKVEENKNEKVTNSEQKVQKEESKPRKPKKKPVIDKNELIEIANNTNGKFIYVSPKSGAKWTLEGYGATDFLEMYELITIRSSYPRFLTDPKIIVLDDDAVDFLGLRDLYDRIIRPGEIDDFFELPVDEMESFVRKAPKGTKILIASKAREKIANNEFDSMSKIRMLESVLGTDLSV